MGGIGAVLHPGLGDLAEILWSQGDLDGARLRLKRELVIWQRRGDELRVAETPETLCEVTTEEDRTGSSTAT